MRTRQETVPRRYSRMGVGGDGSTLNLDFTAMSSLDSRFTFSRASTVATYVNSSGYIATATTNEPRFDYNPTTLAPSGLLIEGSAINLAYHSENLSNAVWTSDNSGAKNRVFTSVSATTPANGATVNQVVLNKTGGTFSRLQQTAVVGTTSSTYTFSVWMRTVTGTSNVGLRLGSSTGINCLVTTTWTRFTHTYALADTGASPQIMLWDNIIGNDETATIYVWGVQVELGTSASSYIPTVASQVQRLSDECYMADISSFNYSNTSASMAMQFMYAKQSTGYVEQIGFMTATDQAVIESFANGLTFFTAVRGAGISTGGQNEVTNTFTLNTAVKYAYSVDTITDPIIKVNLNGSAATVNKVGTGNTYTPTRFVFGRLPAASYGSSFGSVTIKSVKYWPTTKTAQELAALTT